MHPRVAGQLRVERGRKKITTAGSDDVPVMLRENLDIDPDALDPAARE